MTAFSLTLTPRRARVHRAIDGDYVSVARRAEAAPYRTSTARAGIARRAEAAPYRTSTARAGIARRAEAAPYTPFSRLDGRGMGCGWGIRRRRGGLPAQARHSFTKRDFRIAASRVASASLRLLPGG